MRSGVTWTTEEKWEIYLVSVARKNNSFLQYPIRKLTVSFSIILELKKKKNTAI